LTSAAPSTPRVLLWLALAFSVGASAYTYWRDTQDQDELVGSDPFVAANTRTSLPKVTLADPVMSLQAASSPASSETTSTLDGARVGKSRLLSDLNQDPTRRDVAAEHAKTLVLSDPFAPLAVELPPAPKPVVAPVIAPPSAPVLPFLYAGKFEQPVPKNSADPELQGRTSQTVVYLTRGNESFAVSSGDAIDASYRFVGLEGETLVFLYLPLSTKQTLNIGP